jgi:biotin-(acetyl-CoA carboxylase) ligase
MGVVADACNPNTWDNLEFEAQLHSEILSKTNQNQQNKSSSLLTAGLAGCRTLAHLVDWEIKVKWSDYQQSRV